jgi:hypothetical protein
MYALAQSRQALLMLLHYCFAAAHSDTCLSAYTAVHSTLSTPTLPGHKL